MLAAAYDDVLSERSALGLKVFSNVQAVTVDGVVVDPPSIVSLSPALVECQYKISCVTSPPGDYRAVKALLTMADTILAGLTSPSRMTASDGVYAVGNQELPTYQITATYNYRRSSP